MAAPTTAPTAPAAGAPGPLSALLGNPVTIPAAAALAALMLAFAWWRLRRRRTEELQRTEPQPEPQPEAMADADAQSQSEVPYAPSQIVADGDVDPVSEADVYLAYGREQQAEDILLEALRLHPQRLPVRLKLLEIYAQRPDPARFEAAARELRELTGGTGAEWDQACAWGRQIDPDNPLYRPATPPEADGAPEIGSDAAAAVEPPLDAGQPAAAPSDDEFDFDLDLSADSDGTAAASPSDTDTQSADANGVAAPSKPAEVASSGLDFELDLPQDRITPTSAAVPEVDLELEVPTTTPAQPPVTASGTTGMPTLPPELQDLSLDLSTEEPPAPSAATGESVPEAPSSLEVTETETLDENDPLETKLSLAREFEAIGDIDGARTLAEEVAAEASGALQERARAFLAQLG
ncbi:hypothetical protein Tchar_00416 [Tepidimonas charontis]|uniref:Uncharacterized protein n=1 Tax=Tepidimonas charontis TaxID=2267262 RepID=A0A554XJS3_9BURK|nr:hypothetical protein Tchar_00416 [Tepidimonas charontis]